MKKILLIGLLCWSTFAIAQSMQENDKKTYRATPTKINDLIHTKLNATFNYEKSQLNGNVWINLKPHFYATDSLLLDAKGMQINKVQLVKKGKYLPLKYQYNGKELNIRLDKSYTRKELYTIYIDYIAKPNELEAAGSAAITDAKGLYFINPTGEDKDKPTQIWTQGETEATSVWVPTIDKTNQKSTQEFNLTVPAKYVSLSNGKLAQQVINKNGTRTDKWVMTQPNSPYLFFIGVGDYAVVKDQYKGKEVSYYVEKPYEKVARKIFGNTPEMMQFFSTKLGVEYPWVKYSQIVGRDYVSGAMENTTATLHQESAQQDARQLVDGNEWESTIAHELFHHWFGDLVTAESWSNLTVNESFADYSQYLWLEYKYGADEAGHENYSSMQSYLSNGKEASKDLVRFYYNDKEDMFDLVSYQKGGRILNMLRNIVGDDAFFKSLNKYLTDNKYSNGSAHKLRMAFEAVTGKDLNWYFNQWYFGNGHPKLTISYRYYDSIQQAAVIIKQTQNEKSFTLPIAIDVYEGAVKKRYTVWASSKADTFYFPATMKPTLINVDADKVLLAEKKENKTIAEYEQQYKYGGQYLDRREAIEFAGKRLGDSIARRLVELALKDKYYRLRSLAINILASEKLSDSILLQIASIAKKDDAKKVRAEAIELLGRQKNNLYKSFFTQAVKDSSYSVSGAALEALNLIDGSQAFTIAMELSKKPAKGRLGKAITNVIIDNGNESNATFVLKSFNDMPLSSEKFSAIGSLSKFLEKVEDPTNFKNGVDAIVSFRDAIPQQVRAQTDPFINSMILKGLMSKKEKAGATELAEYIKSKLAE
jgi:aminopeptidase N